MKKVLITGGAGFVGRNFTRYFLDLGWDVTVVDSIAKLTGGIDPETWINFQPYDYNNFNFITKTINIIWTFRKEEQKMCILI